MTNRGETPAPVRPLAPLRPRWPLWSLLLVAAFVAVAAVWIPNWTMRPFEPQSPSGLTYAFALRRLAPAATLLALLLAAGLAWRLWRGTRWVGRLALVASLLAIGACAWIARQEVFEKWRTWSAARRSPSPTERSATPVWCGTRRWKDGG